MVFVKILLYCVVVMVTVYLTMVTADDDGPFPSVVPCNYTEQSGSSCVSCNQSLLCFGNNMGLLWNCGGLTPNCRDGICTITAPENCTRF